MFQSLITWIINMNYVSKFDNLNNKHGSTSSISDECMHLPNLVSRGEAITHLPTETEFKQLKRSEQPGNATGNSLKRL